MPCTLIQCHVAYIYIYIYIYIYCADFIPTILVMLRCTYDVCICLLRHAALNRRVVHDNVISMSPLYSYDLPVFGDFFFRSCLLH